MTGIGAVLAALILVIGAVAGAAPLSFTIGTSEPVVVDTSGGTPLIWLDFGGGEARAATYRSGSGTAALEFAYDIAAGDFAPAGIVAAGQVELLGRATEPGVAQQGQLQLQLLDVQGLGVDFGVAGGEFMGGSCPQLAELGLQGLGEGLERCQISG